MIFFPVTCLLSFLPLYGAYITQSAILALTRLGQPLVAEEMFLLLQV